MHEDERDLLEVLIFDEIEETVGTWLRAIIQRLEKEQTAIRQAPSEVCKAGVADCVGPAASSSDFWPIRF